MHDTGNLGVVFMGTGTANSYTYDDNGNITFDPSIDADIAYNYLNLPDSIVFEDGKKFKYQYDFSGTLHRKIEFMNDTIKSYRDYLNGVEFYNSDIDFIHHNNGYIQNGSTCVSDSILTLIGNETINKTYLASEIISNKIVNPADSIDYLAQDTICLIPGFEVPLGNTYLAEIEEYDCDTISPQWEYIFGIKDHLANTRLAFGDLNKNEEIEPDEIISRHDYYPFGLEIDGEWKQQNHYAYRYNGKEKQEFGWYNYGARFYDPSIGRFTGVDPISDQFPHVSTYNYAENEPIANIDLWGLQAHSYTNLLKSKAASLGNQIMGTNIPTTGESNSGPLRHGKITINAEGNLQAGLGLKAKASAFGITGSVKADAGSFKVAEGSIGADGVSGSIMDSENYGFERGASISVNATDNAALQAGFTQTLDWENGEVISNTIQGKAGLTVGNATYGLSTGDEQIESSNVETFSISVGFGAQLIIGGEAKIKMEFKTSTNKEDLK